MPARPLSLIISILQPIQVIVAVTLLRNNKLKIQRQKRCLITDINSSLMTASLQLEVHCYEQLLPDAASNSMCTLNEQLSLDVHCDWRCTATSSCFQMLQVRFSEQPSIGTRSKSWLTSTSTFNPLTDIDYVFLRKPEIDGHCE